MCSNYGEVFRAVDSRSGNSVALKKARVYGDHNDLLKEGTFLKQCNSNFIVKYYDMFYDQNAFYVTYSWKW